MTEEVLRQRFLDAVASSVGRLQLEEGESCIVVPGVEAWKRLHLDLPYQ